jgi:hypothetical protein
MTMMTTTINATAILIIRNRASRNDFSNVVHPAEIVVFFLDDEDDEVDSKTFAVHEGAKARAYAIKASEKQGIRLLGLCDFDAGHWY